MQKQDFMENFQMPVPQSICGFLTDNEKIIEHFNFLNYDVYMTSKRLLCKVGMEFLMFRAGLEIIGIRFTNILMPRISARKNWELMGVGMLLFFLGLIIHRIQVFIPFFLLGLLFTALGVRDTHSLEIPIVTSYDTGDVTLRAAKGAEISRKDKVVLKGSRATVEALYDALAKFLHDPVGKAACLLIHHTPSEDLEGRVGFVEASVMKGRGNLTTTGLMGEVMQESVRAAVTYAKENCIVYGIDENFPVTKDIHVHFPEAYPKDGPSAGVSMTHALISTLTGIPVKRDVAMTGEITIKGEILPVGGVPEKLLAAYNSGVRTIILPIDNQPEVERRVPQKIKKEIMIKYVEHLDEALRIGLTQNKFKP